MVPPPGASTGVAVRSAALAELAFLVGSWQGAALEPGSQEQPVPTSSSLRAEFEWILGGCHLRGVFHYSVGGIPYECLTLWSHDPASAVYRVCWLDSHSSAVTVFEGSLARSGRLVLVATRKMEQQVVTECLTLSKLGVDRWRLVSESDALGPSAVAVTLDATRSR
jgi:hypothetical protein